MTIEIIKGHDNQVANFFSSPSNTPETDEKVSVGLENADRECVPAEFARKLEHERDEAMEAFVIATDQMVQAQCQVRETRVTIEDAKRALKATAYEGILLAAMRVKEERDEAMELLASEKITRNHIIKRSVEVERERDEAMEALMKIEEVFIDSDDTYEDWRKMGNIARAVVEAVK